ncbi:MAG: ribonuclease III [Bacteroidota bacterium]|nr:ribonuclease III [Bacteroidota bacterium]
MDFISSFFGLFNKKKSKERQLRKYIYHLTGKEPANLDLYFLALRHSSSNKDKSEYIEKSNERLEYLGDAILGAIVAEYLFKKYPFKDEGFLTEIRSRIVNGESLGTLAKKIGLNKFIVHNSYSLGKHSNKSMHGDALEALVGAIYLDRGFKFCRKFVLQKLLDTILDIEEIVSTDNNYKSKLIIWGQNNFKKVRFEIIQEKDHKHYKEFEAKVYIDDEPRSVGNGSSKKKAEQDAARRECEVIGI